MQTYGRTIEQAASAGGQSLRTIETHRVNPANDRLTITVLDRTGPGGANHEYQVSGFDGMAPVVIGFQNGPINEAGVNGLTHEVLLAIIADRLEAFQQGTFANDWNAVALNHVKHAMDVLHARTKARMARGVEGTHQQ